MDKVLLAAKYVEGDLNEAEYVEFKHAIKYDKELQQYLRYYKDMHQNLGGQLKDALSFPRFKKSKIEREDVYVGEKITFGLDYLWFFTVALVLIIGVLVWKPWKPDLYQQFKISEQQVVTELDKSSYKNFDLAAKFYNDKQYYEAKHVVSKLYMKNPEDVKLGYYYAVMLLENNCFETIIKVLSPIYHSNSDYRYNAAYMMALSYLRQGNYVDCQQWLAKIPEGSTYYQRANELSAKLANQPV